jgi:hypothetical protein
MPAKLIPQLAKNDDKKVHAACGPFWAYLSFRFMDIILLIKELHSTRFRGALTTRRSDTRPAIQI